MACAHRIKNAEGRWALGQAASIFYEPWISEDLAALWKKARAADPEGKKSKWIQEALGAVEQLGMGKAQREVLVPLGDEDNRRVERRLEEHKKAYLSRDHSFQYVLPMPWRSTLAEREREWATRVPACHMALARQEAPRRQVQYAGEPRCAWVDQPGRATLFESTVAADLIRAGAAAVRVRKALPRALTELKKLGFEPQGLEEPLRDNLRSGCKELVDAQVEVFDAATEFDAKPCVAVYVNENGRKGFLNAQGQARNSLGEAALFSGPKEAGGFARKFATHAHCVEVVASAVAFAPLLGNPKPAEDLAAVIASRERKELEEALGRARIEQLEEELARRKLLESPARPEGSPRGSAGRL
jgi:hypothetical protein